MSGNSDYSDSRSYDWTDDSHITKKSAKAYASEENREYTGGNSSTGFSSNGIACPYGKNMSTISKFNLALVVDVTGSMKEWPKLIFDKIPALYNESNAALQKVDIDELKNGKTIDNLLEISVLAIGDAYCDSRPLQAVNYSKGKELIDGVNAIFPEGGGGSFGQESYELAAYYLNEHYTTPKLTTDAKPLLIFTGDEDFYNTVSKSHVKEIIGDTISASLKSDDVIAQLAQKFDMYVLRPEPLGPGSVYVRAQKHWESLLGAQRVLKMDDPKRLVDCIIGICAYAADNFDEGVKILERRQTKAQVDEVLKTLHPLLGKK